MGSYYLNRRITMPNKRPWGFSNIKSASFVPEKLDLSGGNLDATITYNAPNNIMITSSAPTYPSSGNYYLGYMFNESYGTAANEYWLSSSTGTQTLTINMSSISDSFKPMTIRIYPYTRTDASSDYRISQSTDGESWNLLTGFIENHHTISDPNYIAPGEFREHDLIATLGIDYIRIEVTRNGSWGSTLNEIEIYGVWMA